MTKDVFRKVYKPLKPEASDLIVQMKTKADELLELFSQVSSREMSVAITQLETALMWSTKAVVLQGEADEKA